MKKAISRDMDINGRLVVPKEMRRELMLRKLEDTINLDKDTGAVEVNMYMDGDRLIIERKNPACAFCGTEDDIAVKYRKKYVCKYCLHEISAKR